MQELEEAKATVSRLTLNQAKSAGWEVRLNNVTQERDDIKQELDVERQRVKSSEGHIAVLKERCSMSFSHCCYATYALTLDTS